MGCGNTVVIGSDCQSGGLMELQSYYGVRQHGGYMARLLVGRTDGVTVLLWGAGTRWL